MRMPISTSISVPLAIALALGARACDCGGDDPVNPTTSRIDGRVTDVAGTALTGVAISGAGATASSIADGTYELESAAIGTQVITFSRSGYIAASRTVTMPEHGSTAYLPITLMKLAPPIELDVHAGGTVLAARGASITAPPEAFVDEQGLVVGGTVAVSLTPFDPAIPEESRAYPGELRGRTLDGALIPLITYGVLDVTVTKDGRVVRVKEGAEVTVAVPAPSGQEPVETTRMWRYDVASAEWVESNNTGSYDSGTATYRSRIDPGVPLDLSLNCDNPMRPTCVMGKVLHADGTPFRGALVTAESNPSYGIYSYQTTDHDGAYCMTVEMESEVKLTISTGDSEDTTRSFTAGHNLTNTYPADCLQETCKILRPIVAGTPDPGPLDEARCTIDPQNNPFTGSSCASSLGYFYGCFKPSGACTYEMEIGENGASSTIEFANGSKMTTSISMTGTEFAMVTEYYGPGGIIHCGRATYSEMTMTIDPDFGTPVVITFDLDGGLGMECTGGGRVELTAEQIEAMAACTGQTEDSGGSGETGAACTAKPGTLTGECTTSWDCESDFGEEMLECCGGRTGKKGICLPAGSCEAACETNLECSRFDPSFICCWNGMFDMCMPQEACE